MLDFKDTYLRQLCIKLHEISQDKEYTLVTTKNLLNTKDGQPRAFKLYRSFGGFNWYPYVKVKNILPIKNDKLVELHFEYKKAYDIHVELEGDYNETWWIIPNIDYALD